MRVAVLSDIHANLAALDSVIASFGSVDAVWHLGDVVGYGPEPDGVVERLSEIGAVGVRGNHDAAAIGGKEIDWFNPDARAAMEWTRRRISGATRDWLAALPERHTDGEFGLVHGSPREPLWEYIVSVPIARASLAALTTPFGRGKSAIGSLAVTSRTNARQSGAAAVSDVAGFFEAGIE